MTAEELKFYLMPYLNEVAVKKGRKYICPLCNSGTGKKGTPAFSIVPRTNETQWKCHACGEGGDVIDLDRLLNGGTNGDAMKRLQAKYNGSTYIPPKRTKSEKPEPPTDYTEFFFKAREKLHECDYLAKRGISEKVQNAFGIGFVPDWKHPNAANAPASPRVIIPTSKYSYLARDVRQNLTDKQNQYSKQKVGKMHILNADALYLEKNYCFIVEGEIDCLSVIQCGYNCIGLGSANVIESKLLPMCRKKKPKLTLIFALDNDEAGQTWTKKISEFRKLGVRCITADICGECKDPNELLVKNPQMLKENLRKAVEAVCEEKADLFENSCTDYNADGSGELTLANLTEYLRAKSITVRYNIITHQTEYSGFSGESAEHLKETAPTLIYDELHFELKGCTIEKVGQFMNVISTRNRFNPILEVIQSVEWDGRDRIDDIYNIFGIPQHDRLSRTIIHKWFMQCYCGLHNSMENPFSLDIVLIFQGAQGIGKTRFLEKLALSPRYFGEGRTYDPRNKDSQIECTSKWICELGEIGSTMKKDIDSLKAFLTSSTDEYRMPYGKAALRYVRRTSFCGTTNDMQFLVDETGNRRFATIAIPEGIVIDYDRDVKNFNAVQLWAQVAEEVETMIAVSDCDYSSVFRLTRDELAELNNRNAEHLKPLKGELEVIDVLEQLSKSDSGYTVEQRAMTVTEFIELNPVLKKYTAQQISKVLDKLGYQMIKKRVEGKASVARVRILPYRKYLNYNQVTY